MSSTKIGEAVSKEDVTPTAVYISEKPKQAKGSAPVKGSKFTPKSEMRVGRNWNQGSWEQSFAAISKKWDKENHSKKGDLK